MGLKRAQRDKLKEELSSTLVVTDRETDKHLEYKDLKGRSVIDIVWGAKIAYGGHWVELYYRVHNMGSPIPEEKLWITTSGFDGQYLDLNADDPSEELLYEIISRNFVPERGSEEIPKSL